MIIDPYRYESVQAFSDWGVQILAGWSTGPTASVGDIEMALVAGGANAAVGGVERNRRTSFNPTAAFVTDTRIFDGDLSTARDTQAAFEDSTLFAYQFTTPVTLREVRIASPFGAFGTRGPLGFLVVRSFDSRVTWVPVALFSTPNTWSAGEVRAFPFDPTAWVPGTGRNAARAWRVVANGWPSGSNPRIGDVAFAAAPGGPTLCVGGSAIAAGNGFSQNPNLAFDGNVTTFWNGIGAALLGQRLGYAFLTPVNVVELRLRAPATLFSSMPTTFDVQWSNDVINWTTALTVTGAPGWSASELRTYAIP